MSLPLPCSHAEQVMALANRQGVLRPVDLAPLGIQAEVLRRLLARGLIKKIGRGRYVPAGVRLDPPLVWAGVARAVPNGVLCLRSALTLHKVMAMPLEPVDLAIERRAAKPRLAEPSLWIARMGDEAFTEGVEVHVLHGVSVPVYSLEKTLADVFKFRNKIGPHIAVDALRAALQRNQVHLDRLHHYARICRVERVMQPYLDALVTPLS